MNIQYSSDNMEISESMKELALSKLERLFRMWSHVREDSVAVRLVMNSAPEETFLVKVEINLDGDEYYTNEKGYGLETALVSAIDEIVRQYKKKKSRASDDWAQAREGKVLTEAELEEMAESETADLETADTSQE